MNEENEELVITGLSIEPIPISKIYGVEGYEFEGEFEAYPKEDIYSVDISYSDYTLGFYDSKGNEVFRMVDLSDEGFNFIIKPFSEAIENIKKYEGF